MDTGNLVWRIPVHLWESSSALVLQRWRNPHLDLDFYLTQWIHGTVDKEDGPHAPPIKDQIHRSGGGPMGDPGWVRLPCGTDHLGPTVSVLKFLHVRVKYGGNLDCKIRLEIPSSGSNLDWISFLMKFNLLCCEIHARTKVWGKKQMENRDFPVPSVNHT